jgi:hypothetical protein
VIHTMMMMQYFMCYCYSDLIVFIYIHQSNCNKVHNGTTTRERERDGILP